MAPLWRLTRWQGQELAQGFAYSGRMGVAEVVQQLRADKESGALAELCDEHGVELLTLFGSARLYPERARDVDVAYQFRPGAMRDDLAVVNALGGRYGDLLDIMPLDRAGEVARYAALGPAEVLVELDGGVFARSQMRAFRDYCDTQRFRDLMVEVMAR